VGADFLQKHDASTYALVKPPLNNNLIYFFCGFWMKPNEPLYELKQPKHISLEIFIYKLL
jgi:hypothetical protein